MKKFILIKNEDGNISFYPIGTKVPKSSKDMGYASTPEEAKDMIEKNMFKPRVRIAGKMYKLDLAYPDELSRAKAIAGSINFLPVN